MQKYSIKSSRVKSCCERDTLWERIVLTYVTTRELVALTAALYDKYPDLVYPTSTSMPTSEESKCPLPDTKDNAAVNLHSYHDALDDDISYTNAPNAPNGPLVNKYVRSKAVSANKEDAKWVCPKCTVSNAAHRYQCVVCGYVDKNRAKLLGPTAYDEE